MFLMYDEIKSADFFEKLDYRILSTIDVVVVPCIIREILFALRFHG